MKRKGQNDVCREAEIQITDGQLQLRPCYDDLYNNERMSFLQHLWNDFSSDGVFVDEEEYDDSDSISMTMKTLQLMN